MEIDSQSSDNLGYKNKQLVKVDLVGKAGEIYKVYYINPELMIDSPFL